MVYVFDKYLSTLANVVKIKIMMIDNGYVSSRCVNNEYPKSILTGS